MITCPFCREMILSLDVASLPNNSYALHMLRFKEKKAPNSAVTLSYVFVKKCVLWQILTKNLNISEK
jgi:hypothetical protein